MNSTTGNEKAIYDFTVKDINGEEKRLSMYRRKVLLIVNVASECGYTPQYIDLQTLFKIYEDKGFVILGFPANNFGFQEPGTAKEIRAFCERNYGVSFDMFSKISVKGSDQHPLFRFITSDENVGGDVKWNFSEVLGGQEWQPDPQVRVGSETFIEGGCRFCGKCVK